MEIEVGEYVRTKPGLIRRVVKVHNNLVVVDKSCRYETKDLRINTYAIFEKEIKKHSKNLIDIVELGDYVNGEKITMYGTYMKHKTVENESCFFVNEDIESVVTKQQFSDIEYKVEE